MADRQVYVPGRGIITVPDGATMQQVLGGTIADTQQGQDQRVAQAQAIQNAPTSTPQMGGQPTMQRGQPALPFASPGGSGAGSSGHGWTPRQEAETVLRLLGISTAPATLAMTGPTLAGAGAAGLISSTFNAGADRLHGDSWGDTVFNAGVNTALEPIAHGLTKYAPKVGFKLGLKAGGYADEGQRAENAFLRTFRADAAGTNEIASGAKGSERAGAFLPIGAGGRTSRRMGRLAEAQNDVLDTVQGHVTPRDFTAETLDETLTGRQIAHDRLVADPAGLYQGVVRGQTDWLDKQKAAHLGIMEPIESLPRRRAPGTSGMTRPEADRLMRSHDRMDTPFNAKQLYSQAREIGKEEGKTLAEAAVKKTALPDSIQIPMAAHTQRAKAMKAAANDLAEGIGTNAERGNVNRVQVGRPPSAPTSEGLTLKESDSLYGDLATMNAVNEALGLRAHVGDWKGAALRGAFGSGIGGSAAYATGGDWKTGATLGTGVGILGLAPGTLSRTGMLVGRNAKTWPTALRLAEMAGHEDTHRTERNKAVRRRSPQ